MAEVFILMHLIEHSGGSTRVNYRWQHVNPNLNIQLVPKTCIIEVLE